MLPPTQVSPSQRRSLSRLALRTAGPTAAAAALVTAGVLLIPMPGWLTALSVGLAAGLAAYVTVSRLVSDRIELARATLRQARKREFEALGRLQLERRRDELDEVLWQVYRAGRVLQKEIERLEELEHYRRDFIGNVSHELKTPIFVISGFAEQLLAGALEDPRVNRRFVEKIGRNAHRLDLLARDLLAISKIESGELRMQETTFPLRGLVEEVIEALESVAETKGVTLVENVAPSLPPVRGDRDQLRQALANLVENGIKYNREGGRVEVAAEPIMPAEESLPQTLRIVVADDGLGIPEAALPRITERFYRVDRSRNRQQGGTGLGLAIVKHVLEAHGRSLHVESKPGHGSAFSFELPVVLEMPEGQPEG